jgi:hypothetical protein
MYSLTTLLSFKEWVHLGHSVEIARSLGEERKSRKKKNQVVSTCWYKQYLMLMHLGKFHSLRADITKVLFILGSSDTEILWYNQTGICIKVKALVPFILEGVLSRLLRNTPLRPAARWLVEPSAQIERQVLVNSMTPNIHLSLESWHMYWCRWCCA